QTGSESSCEPALSQHARANPEPDKDRGPGREVPSVSKGSGADADRGHDRTVKEIDQSGAAKSHARHLVSRTAGLYCGRDTWRSKACSANMHRNHLHVHEPKHPSTPEASRGYDRVLSQTAGGSQDKTGRAGRTAGRISIQAHVSAAELN